MPDPLSMLGALAAAAVVAAAVLLLGGLPWRAPGPRRAAVGWVAGVGLGFYVGFLLACRLLGSWPHWPPREDQDRLLALLLPAAIAVELVAALLPRLRWPVWLLRLVVAGAAARILLHNTVYLVGPGTLLWTPLGSWLILAGLGAALAAEWALLLLLAERAPGRSLPLALGFTCAAAGVVVMLSGYATGGLPGLVLGAALVGAAVGSFALRGAPDARGAVGVGVVGLFALLVSGHFFGQLTAVNAVLLFLAPLLCWVPELPLLRLGRPWLRGLVRAGAVAVLLGVVVFLAQHKFDADVKKHGDDSGPTADDYSNFRP
jgi:hypothetical protein